MICICRTAAKYVVGANPCLASVATKQHSVDSITGKGEEILYT